MGIGSEILREYLVLFLDIVRKRWLLMVIPIAVAGVLSMGAMKLAPTKYTASSLILLQAANRAPGSFGGGGYTNTVEQVQAVEAWLKSDQVLAELVPRMAGSTPPKTPLQSIIQRRALAASLSLEVVGNSVLQIRMESNKPQGLGRNLEMVLARLMEGVTGPEQNIFSAPQFVRLRRDEEAAAAEAALMRAIEADDVQAPAQIRAGLQQLWTMTRNIRSPGQAEEADRLRRSISDDTEKLAELERLYAAYRDAVDRQAAFQAHAGASRSNYVSFFNSPDDLLIIGRPSDPIAGESSARKIAMAGMLLSLVLGGGLVVLAELMSCVLRTRREFEMTSGVPVVARIGKISGLPVARPVSE